MNPRRRFLKSAAATAAGGAVLAAVGSGAPDARAQARGRTFVLVHGAWHGGWCWSRLTPLLRAKGHAVYAPTLTGLGDRAHLHRPDTDLETHVQDVVAMMDMEGLVDVTLVGHSYAGFVVTGVADRVAQRISRLVYLDAYVPEGGKSLADYITPNVREGFLKAGEQNGFRSFPVEHFGVLKPEDQAWVGRRLVNQPYRTFVQPVTLRNPLPKVPRSYIQCTQPAMRGPFGAIAGALRNNPAWKVHELKTGHDAMVTDPAGLARLLLA
jgi:pimeloyl-ACP methyl ester carboxylesterase